MTPPPAPVAPPAPQEVARPRMDLPKPPPVPGMTDQVTPAMAMNEDVHRLVSTTPWLCRQRVFTVRNHYDIKDQQDNVLFTIIGKLFTLFPKFKIVLPSSPNFDWVHVNWRWAGLRSLWISHFFLTTDTGQVIAVFKKNMFLDIFISHWHITDTSGQEFAHAVEDSLFRAIFNRYAGRIFRTNFDIFFGGEHVAKFVRQFTLVDRYTMDIQRSAHLDEQGAAIMAALVAVLDRGQKR